jgi:hypothetical protein
MAPFVSVMDGTVLRDRIAAVLDRGERAPEPDGGARLGARDVPIERRCAPVARREREVIEGPYPREEARDARLVRDVDHESFGALAEPLDGHFDVHRLA